MQSGEKSATKARAHFRPPRTGTGLTGEKELEAGDRWLRVRRGPMLKQKQKAGAFLSSAARFASIMRAMSSDPRTSQ